MSTVKSCSNCGADNETVYRNCIFCKTALPSLNPDEISTDELISKATLWVNRASSGQFVVDQSKESDTAAKKFIAALNPKILRRPEIIANAEQYLALLSLRSENNGLARENLLSLKDKLEKISKKPSFEETELKKLAKIAIIGFAVFLIFMFLVSNIETKGFEGFKGRSEVEVERLQVIELSVQNHISEKKYDAALFELESLRFMEGLNTEWGQAGAKQYDEKRQALKELIEKMKAQEGQ